MSQDLELPSYSDLLDADALARLRGSVPAWWHEAYDDLSRMLVTPNPKFPCIYAIRALRNDTLRFVFLRDSESDASIVAFASALSQYVKVCQSLTPHTAFLAFFAADLEEMTLEQHHSEFWRVLQRLHELDPSPWPAQIPSDPAEPLWEFCFDGEPMFVLGSGPVHVARHSRYSAVRTISFQPRFMFDELISAPNLLNRARRIIRDRVIEMDGFPVHPMIQMYHEEGNREWRQYVVPEDNLPIDGACPFHAIPR
ncbi:MAG: YqcI/YcgG family protein [Solirubrobacteraceae bacterium]